MDGNVLLSWRLQNVVFIMAVVIGLVIIAGLAGQAFQLFGGGDNA